MIRLFSRAAEKREMWYTISQPQPRNSDLEMEASFIGLKCHWLVLLLLNTVHFAFQVRILLHFGGCWMVGGCLFSREVAAPHSFCCPGSIDCGSTAQKHLCVCTCDCTLLLKYFSTYIYRTLICNCILASLLVWPKYSHPVNSTLVIFLSSMLFRFQYCSCLVQLFQALPDVIKITIHSKLLKL